MDIDIYQTCPCQSGKKIKFCCSKDILPDLNQVMSLHHGKQFTAALEKLGRLKEKHGPKACLLGLMTHELIHLKDYEKASEVNEQFQRENPRNPLGYQHAALLMAAEGRADEAVAALQNGLDACSKNEIPITMANAFRTVGMLLMSQGKVVAGRAHLIFASELRNGEDEVVSQLVLQTFRSPEIPLLLKSEFPVFVPDEDCTFPWASKYLNAARFASAGRWRAARILARKLLDEYPDQPELIFSLAVWSMYLADNEAAKAELEKYSQLDAIDTDQAIEARATSFVIDEQPITSAYDFVLTSWEVNDVESLNEKAISSNRIITGSIYSHNFIDPESPPPQAGYLLLDADEVRAAADAEGDNFPRIIGEVLVYGRQTDRAARADFYSVRDLKFDEGIQGFAEALGDCLGGKDDGQVVEQISKLDHEMSVKWHLPSDMSVEQRQEFVTRQREREYMEIFPTVPFQVLGERTPEVVAKDDSSKRDLAAVVLMMEQGADALSTDSFDFNKLREKLGLPIPQPIDTSQRDFEGLSPIETQRVDFVKLDDEQLIKAYVLASSCGNIRVLRASGPVILERPEMEKFIRFEMIYVMLARLNSDSDQALEIMQKARKHATAADRPIGGLLIDELELRLERNRPEGCQELLRVLQAGHLQDPQNQYRLASVLQRFGIMGPDGRMRSDPAESAQQVAAGGAGEQPGIWKPGDPEPAGSTGSGGEQGSKLWLPD